MPSASSGTNRAARRKRRKSPVAVEPHPSREAVTAPEAAFLLNCSPNTVWNLLSTGQLKSFRLGRKRLIARSAVEDFIAAGGTGANR
jgi:excisionase family DNA binding protein